MGSNSDAEYIRESLFISLFVCLFLATYFMTGESCGGELKSGELLLVGSRSEESVSEPGKEIN